MRVILANRYFYPDQSATSRMVTSLAFALASEGIETKILTSRNFHNRSNELLPARETIQDVEIHRLWTSHFGRGRLAARAIDYTTFHLSAAAWFAAHTRKDDLCVICTDPPLLSVSCALPIRMNQGKLVNWVMDLFPETAIELGLFNSDQFTGKLAMALRNWSMRQATLTICPIDAMARHLAKKGMPPQNLSVVHHWADRDEIHPVAPASNNLRRSWGLGRRFVIGYSGNFGRAHEFETVIRAAEQLKHMKSIAFLMIGEGQQRAYVESEVKRRQLTNVILKPFQPVEQLSESLGAANVHLVSLKPELEHCIVPSKFYGVLAAGRPTIFIGDTNGEIARIVRDFRCGFAVSPGDVDSLIQCVFQLKRSLVGRTTMGNNARYLMETAYSREYGTAMWQTSIGRLAGAMAPVMPILDRELRPGKLP
ncbi:glycosyltransferase family 4 protein [Ochrobactrum sp. CM-21-5]|nr:glycosyltransferase family 4 protein [Ochrobactrum sp. CM-21-5]MBC2886435.1 glycosyltransferase family 4 protein [Ochrobactrum sp. CM-21-5]